MTEPVASPVATAPSSTSGPVDRVDLRLPADPAYLSLLRTTTAGLAARMSFTLEEIDELRIAVDEAAALLLPDIIDGELVAGFAVSSDLLEVTVAAHTAADHRPTEGSFAWTVLTALAGEVALDTDPEGRSQLRLRKRRSPQE